MVFMFGMHLTCCPIKATYSMPTYFQVNNLTWL